MSDPGPDPDGDIEQVRTELQHATEDATGEERTILENLTEALGNLDAAHDDPKQDNLESVRAELARLEDDTEGETRRYVTQAREHVREIIKDRLAESETVGEDEDGDEGAERP